MSSAALTPGYAGHPDADLMALLSTELHRMQLPVIVALGSATIKRFVPGLKGGAGEMIGKTFYDPVLDATIICGLNAQQIGFDPDKQEVLDLVFKQVADVLS